LNDYFSPEYALSVLEYGDFFNPTTELDYNGRIIQVNRKLVNFIGNRYSDIAMGVS